MVKRHAPQCKIIAVVKANAYGHGLLPVARTLVDADAYAVARIEEALMLRSCAVVKPIVLLEGFFSAADQPVLAANNLQTAVHTWEQLEALEQAELPAPVVAWLKLDTGIGKQGKLQAAGQVNLAPITAKLDVSTRDIDLRVAQAYISPRSASDTTSPWPTTRWSSTRTSSPTFMLVMPRLRKMPKMPMTRLVAASRLPARRPRDSKNPAARLPMMFAATAAALMPPAAASDRPMRCIRKIGRKVITEKNCRL